MKEALFYRLSWGSGFSVLALHDQYFLTYGMNPDRHSIKKHHIKIYRFTVICFGQFTHTKEWEI